MFYRGEIIDVVRGRALALLVDRHVDFAYYFRKHGKQKRKVTFIIMRVLLILWFDILASDV